MKKTFMGALSLALLTVAVFVPSLASAQSTGSLSSCAVLDAQGAEGVVSCLIGFFNYFIYVIVALSVVYIVIGAFKLMSEEKRDEGKQTIYHGIIALFVMMSIWGFVNILNRTFDLQTNAPARGSIRLIP